MHQEAFTPRRLTANEEFIKTHQIELPGFILNFSQIGFKRLPCIYRTIVLSL